MKKVIIKSRQRWHMYFIVKAYIMVLFCAIVSMLMATAHSGSFMIFFYFLMLMILIATKLWYMRRVIVYSDRVEAKFPLHEERNYQVMWKDVDCYCTEKREIKTKDFTYVHCRIYLLTGNRLWLYISGDTESNFMEMLSVLEDYFGIPERKGLITLGVGDCDPDQYGGYIELTDITEEEMAEMEAQRKKRSRPRSAVKVSAISKLKHFFIEYGLIIVVGYFCLSPVIRMVDTTSIPYLDATTQIPSKQYIKIGSIDIDSDGIYYASEEREFSRGTIKYGVAHWIFKVKGRDDVWIAIASTGSYDNFYESYDKEFCIAALHQPHTYRKSSIPQEKQKLSIRVYSPPSQIENWIKDEHAVLLVYDDKTPVKTGGYIYEEANKRNREWREMRRFPLMKQAAEMGHARAQYELGLMYEFGKGTSTDLEMAIFWYKAAATQRTSDTSTKIDALNQLSYLYANLSQYEKAIATIDEAIAMNPKDANLYDSKGEHLYRSGDIEGAKEMWNMVLMLDPYFLQFHKSELYRLLHKE